MESKYEFRRRLEEVHKPDRRDPGARALPGELEITEDWRIFVGDKAGELMLNTAKDLQDYLFTSMNVSVRLSIVQDLRAAADESDHAIVFATKADLDPLYGDALTRPRSYRIVAAERRIVLCGYDERGTAQASYYLEDQMNIREAPFWSCGAMNREPLFSPRMVHSGWGLDRFPDAHLKAIAHSGIDAIMVFVKDVDETPEGYQDFNYLVDRAALHGLDVYVYSYLVSRLHPDDPGAPEYYEKTYGRIFQSCSRFKGVILVGESCEFPSKDPNTTGMLSQDWPADQARAKPNPGWWPCTDFPQWLKLLTRTIRAHNPEADIVFWTYNWGYAPEEDRLKLVRALPEDITLLVTFEMFEQIQREHVMNVCVDYTLSFIGPGQYFRSESQVAHERGIKLYAMSNTGGLTWDIGVIPFEPFPDQWNERHRALLQAREDWRLCGLMESHHYGWQPSFISDLAKNAYWRPSRTYEEMLAQLAKRDFGADAVPLVLKAWECWSEAIRHYVPTNEDQYGPFRIGPSYPLVFRLPVNLPAASHAMFGNKIVFTDYKPLEDPRQSLGNARVDVELRSLKRMLERMQDGNKLLERALAFTPERKKAAAVRLLGMGKFIALCIITTIHAKLWWKYKQELFRESDPVRAAEWLEKLKQVAERELANAEAAIPLVEADSRLGWEPSMDYMTDPDHLDWKIRQVRAVLDNEFPQYLSSLRRTGRCDVLDNHD